LLFGFWFWNEFPDWMSLLGSAVIILSGMMLMVGQWKGLFSAAKFDRN
jgi:drug/metabolite transporter (DMT)-like permease